MAKVTKKQKALVEKLGDNQKLHGVDDAIAYTEAPEAGRALMKQRLRWTFGTLQAVWKHRDTFARWRYGTLGCVALPNIFLFQIVLPLVSPFGGVCCALRGLLIARAINVDVAIQSFIALSYAAAAGRPARTARSRAARARSRVESSIGKAELASLTISGISVQPSTTASHPCSFRRAITSWK